MIVQYTVQCTLLYCYFCFLTNWALWAAKDLSKWVPVPVLNCKFPLLTFAKSKNIPLLCHGIVQLTWKNPFIIPFSLQKSKCLSVQ